MVCYGVISMQEAGRSDWNSGNSGWKPLKHGEVRLIWLPGQTGSSLPEKGLNTATGAAGGGCNEKSSLHYSRSQKAERSLWDLSFFNIRSGSMTGQFWVAQSFLRIKSWFYILWLISQNKVLFNVCCNIQDAWNTGAIYLIWRITWGNIFRWYYLSFHGRHCLQIFTGRFMH